MFVSGIQKSDSIIHINTYLFFFRPFSIIGYHKILHLVPHATLYLLVIYFIYSSGYILIQTPNFSFATISLFSMSVSLFHEPFEVENSL